MTNRKIRYWVIPPQADGECVAHMEEVLETYEMPHNPAIPVLGMDEQPVPLLKETRPPIAGTAKHAKRVDSEYERASRGVGSPTARHGVRKRPPGPVMSPQRNGVSIGK